MAEQTLSQPAKTWAREYETIYILRPNIDAEEAEKVAQRVQDVMTRLGAKLTKVDTWGKRKLAYPIKRFGRGIFVYVRYVAMNDVVAELERNLGILESVIRFQSILVRDFVELDEVKAEEDEVRFERIEAAPEDDDIEPSTAERLGMLDRSSRRRGPADLEAAGEDDEAEAAGEDDESATDEAADEEEVDNG
ncbi:MAG: 30S ribosomal protein S6 [Myxococcales bacterium]|nr:30S ribosomal protein S6 [Myxococcales bacterium]